MSVASDKVSVPDGMGQAVGEQRWELLARLAGNEVREYAGQIYWLCAEICIFHMFYNSHACRLDTVFVMLLSWLLIILKYLIVKLKNNIFNDYLTLSRHVGIPLCFASVFFSNWPLISETVQQCSFSSISVVWLYALKTKYSFCPPLPYFLQVVKSAEFCLSFWP